MSIQGLMFDFDDTIGNRVQYIYKAYHALVDHFFEDDPFLCETIVQDCMIWDMRGNYNKSFVKENLKKKYNVDLKSLDLQDWMGKKQAQMSEPIEGVHEVLEQLHEKYKMALVTNGLEYIQNYKVNQCGVRDYFDVIVTSQRASGKKPNPEPFELALKELGLRADEVIFIGDTFSTDMYGAHKLGIETVFVCDDKWPCDLDIKRVSHIRELLEWL